jgi:hypothetical protein
MIGFNFLLTCLDSFSIQSCRSCYAIKKSSVAGTTLDREWLRLTDVIWHVFEYCKLLDVEP